MLTFQDMGNYSALQIGSEFFFLSYYANDMFYQLLLRIVLSCVLLLTLPMAADEFVRSFQFPHIFSGIAAIASCLGACVPLLSLFRNSDS